MRILEQCVKWFVIAFVIVVLYFQHYMGLADNGDYDRSLKPFSTGPVGMGGERLLPGTDVWTLRYGSYWIPYWEYQPSWSRFAQYRRVVVDSRGGAELSILFPPDTCMPPLLPCCQRR